MNNLISIIEIPTIDFARATRFYSEILGVDIEVVEMEGMKIGLFPGSGNGPAVQLLHADGYRPSPDGTVVYLNGGDDLLKVAKKIEANGGSIIVPKTSIGSDMGFYAMFTDTEGNRLGLHSAN